MKNPWTAETLDAFTFLCCPECVFRTRKLETFQCHSVKNHPKSEAFFDKILSKILVDRTQNSGQCGQNGHESPRGQSGQNGLESPCGQSGQNECQSPNGQKGHDGQEGQSGQNGQPIVSVFNDIFIKQENETSDTQDSEDDQELLCDQCPFRTTSKYILSKHVQETNCKSCGLSTTCPSILETHEESCDKPKAIIDLNQEHFCQDHNLKFASATPYILHYQFYHSKQLPPEFQEHQGLHSCEKCGHFYASEQGLANHKTKVHLRHCQDCKFQTTISDLFNDHIKPTHCSSCSKTYKCSVRYKVHLSYCPQDIPEDVWFQQLKSAELPSKGSKKTFTCTLCSDGVLFQSKGIYVMHYRRVHNNQLPPEFHGREYFCEHCGKVYLLKHQLLAHLKNAHGDPEKCPHCPLEFAKKTERTAHVQSVHENHEFKCDQCPQRFRVAKYLSRHKMSAHYTKPNKVFKCSKCKGTQFKSRLLLYQHRAEKHDDKLEHIKVFKCTKCPRLFHSQKKRDQHVTRTHSDLATGDHTCTICNDNMVFKGQGAYILHYKSKHGNKLPPEFEDHEKFPCPECGVFFIRETALNRHIQVVHEKTVKRNKKQTCLQCPHCDKTFDRSRKLNSHLQQVHPE